MAVEREYISGLDRNDQHLVAHLYDGDFSDPGLPMCVRGWNRLDGEGYSIFRNCGERICKVCEHRAAKGLDGVPSRKRKTRWL
jgi:hypothetical protein